MELARKRYITSEISVDDKLAAVAEVNPIAALMWPWFIKELDDWGRMKANPREVKLEVFPAFNFTTQEIQAVLDCYHEHGLAWVYEVDGKQYMQVNPESWYRLQSYIQVSRRNRDDSQLPPPLDHPWGQWWPESRWYTDNMEHTLANFADECSFVASIADNRQEAAIIDPSPSPSHTNKRYTRDSRAAKKNDYPSDFEEFWSVYPRKVNKKGAYTKWRATLRKDDAPTKQELIECAKRYAAECKRKGTSQEYIMHAATFLGPQERWRDYMEEAPEPHSQAAPEYLPYSSGADILAIIDERQRKAGGAH